MIENYINSLDTSGDKVFLPTEEQLRNRDYILTQFRKEKEKLFDNQ